MLSGVSRPIDIATEAVDMRKSFDGLAAIILSPIEISGKSVRLPSGKTDYRVALSGILNRFGYIKNHFRSNPLSGHLFVFINRSADRIKILSWDNDGYALWYKRLEAGRFRIPVAMLGEGRQVALVSAAQLAMILEGIEPVVVKKRKRFMLQNTGAN